MKAVRKKVKPVSMFLTFLILVLLVPYQTAVAGLITTQTVLEVTQGHEARGYLHRVLTSEAVQKALIAQDIDPLEAKARVDSLSDAEAARLAGQIEQLPAGAGAAWVGVLIIGYFVVMTILILMYSFD